MTSLPLSTDCIEHKPRGEAEFSTSLLTLFNVPALATQWLLEIVHAQHYSMVASVRTVDLEVGKRTCTRSGKRENYPQPTTNLPGNENSPGS